MQKSVLIIQDNVNVWNLYIFKLNEFYETEFVKFEQKRMTQYPVILKTMFKELPSSALESRTRVQVSQIVVKYL